MSLYDDMHNFEASFFANHLQLVRIIKKALSKFSGFKVLHKKPINDANGWESLISLDIIFEDSDFIQEAKDALLECGFVLCGSVENRHVFTFDSIKDVDVHVYLGKGSDFPKADYFSLH